MRLIFIWALCGMSDHKAKGAAMLELVSIVVPIYNMGDSIQACVKSIQNQDYPNIEIILVDDGSTDNSHEICQRIALEDSRVKPFHTENRGSGPARNYGIDKASGRYVYFPDADDYLEPNAITTMVNAMDHGKYDLVVFGFKRSSVWGKELRVKEYEESSQDAEAIRRDYSDYMTTMSKWGIQGAPWNKFFDLQVIREHGIEYPPLRRHQDEGFIGRYMCYATRVHFIPDILYTYYLNNLQKEWKKYPVDYMDAVIGLHQVRKETILKWNDQDEMTHDYVQREYVSNFIKALELSFSPKMKLSPRARKQWQRQMVVNYQFDQEVIPHSAGVYQKKMMKLIKAGNYARLYASLKFKVSIQQTIVFDLIKGIVCRY